MILVTGANGFVRKRNEFFDNLNVEIVYGDIRNKNDVENAVKGVEKVVHLAAVLGSSNKELNFDVNAYETNNIVESCTRNNIQRLIYVSSVAASRKERSHYGESKLFGESFVKGSILNYVILRPALIYGDGGKGFNKTINYIKKLPLIPIIGRGDVIRRPVYVWDVVNAIVNALENNYCIGKTYDIGGNKVTIVFQCVYYSVDNIP